MKLRIGMSLVAVICAAAVWLYAAEPSSRRSGLNANSDASRTQWLCATCSHAFRLTAREAAAAGPSGQTWPPVRCPACEEVSAYLAISCPTCGTVYFGPDQANGFAQCPHCAAHEGGDSNEDGRGRFTADRTAATKAY